MKRFERARNPEQKDARRAAILAAAREIAREVGPIELGLNEVGRRSGVSKPNIYRYFESREEILLRLLVAELEDLVVEVERGLAACRGEIRAVAALVTREYLARPLLCQLLGMVSSILEHNVSAAAIAASKGEIHALSAVAAKSLIEIVPWLSLDDAVWALVSIALYVAGLWPAANPSATAAEVLARPEFAATRPDASRDLRRFIEVLFRGLEATQSKRGRARKKRR